MAFKLQMNEATRQEEAQVSIQCVAVYDFPAQSPDDLPFSVSDHIEIVERIGADWARGRIGGRQGMFPVSFVEILHQTGSQQGKGDIYDKWIWTVPWGNWT